MITVVILSFAPALRAASISALDLLDPQFAMIKLRNEYSDSVPGMLITRHTAPDRIGEAHASGYLLLYKPVG
jgi:hypothetical protein